MNHRKLGDILVEQSAISRGQLRLGQQGAKASRQRLGQWLVRKGWVTYSDVAKALAEQSGRSYVPPELLRPDLNRLDEYAPGALECLGALPVVDEGRLTVAIADPGDLDLVREIERIVGDEHVHIVVSDENVIRDALAGRYRNRPLYRGSARDKRADRRVVSTEPTECDVTFESGEGRLLFGGPVNGCLLDVSQGGGRFLGAIPQVLGRERVLEANARARCTIDSPGVSIEPFELEATIRWMREVDEVSAEVGLSWLPREGAQASYLRILLIKLHQMEAAAIGRSRMAVTPSVHSSSQTGWRILHARRTWRPE